MTQHLSHNRAADPKLRTKITLHQTIARRKVTFDDGIAHFVERQFAQRLCGPLNLDCTYLWRRLISSSCIRPMLAPLDKKRRGIMYNMAYHHSRGSRSECHWGRDDVDHLRGYFSLKRSL